MIEKAIKADREHRKEEEDDDADDYMGIALETDSDGHMPAVLLLQLL